MILMPSAKILVCHRRLFNEDQPRFFVGTISACEDGLVKVTGFSWTRDPVQGFVRKQDERTKVISLTSGALIVYELPSELLIEDLRIEQGAGHAVVLSDGRKFRMDLAERLAPGHL